MLDTWNENCNFLTDTLRRSDGVGDIPQITGLSREFSLAAAVRPLDARRPGRNRPMRNPMVGKSSAARRLSTPLWALLTLIVASGAWAAAPVVDSFSASPAVVAPGGLITLAVLVLALR